MTQDPLAGLRQEAIRRERATTDRQMAEMAGMSDATPPPPAPFSTSNDDALAAHLQQTREKNVEYLRLQTEDARKHYIDAAADNFRRIQSQQQEGAIRGAMERDQRTAQDSQAGERLAIQMQALTDTFPPNWTPETLSMDQLRALTDLRQQVQTLAAATGMSGLADGVLERGGPLSPANTIEKMARAESFPDGSKAKVTQLEDGRMQVELVTGERFVGDPLTVTQQMADAQVNTKLWARQKVSQAQTAQPVVNQPTEQVQQTPVQPTAQNTIADYWAAEQADALARQFGFSSKNEMLQWGENINQKMPVIARYEDDRLAMDFSQRCPDFPGTEQASDALVNIVKANNWQYNADSLQAAHLLAVQNHVYQPLSAEAIQAANGNAPQMSRATAPPMLRGNSPDSTPPIDPHNIPMDQLRKAAIRQELERSGPGYR
jgi:hypothetical protein